MAVCVRLPRLGANVAEGTVGAWRVREGAPVRAGELLVEILTSKATFEIESPADGVLSEILAPEKSSVPVGYVLAIVGDPDERFPDVSSENERVMAEFRARALRAGGGGAATSAEAVRKLRATPGARRLARELGVELETIVLPTGRNVIREDDVRTAKG